MRFFNRYRALLAACLLIVISASVYTAQQRPAAPAAPSNADQVARGKYLVTIQDCSGCHTPFVKGEPDMTRLLMGHPANGPRVTGPPTKQAGWATAISDDNTAWSTPEGVAFTTNLTSDPETGIGKWTEAMFVNAIRTGKHLGAGRPIMPPMPWKMYAQATDADLKAIFAYLKTVPPIRNKVPDPIPAKK
jgi:mono/diheme cytochrome c family protein